MLFFETRPGCYIPASLVRLAVFSPGGEVKLWLTDVQEIVLTGEAAEKFRLFVQANALPARLVVHQGRDHATDRGAFQTDGRGT